MLVSFKYLGSLIAIVTKVPSRHTLGILGERTQLRGSRYLRFSLLTLQFHLTGEFLPLILAAFRASSVIRALRFTKEF